MHESCPSVPVSAIARSVSAVYTLVHRTSPDGSPFEANRAFGPSTEEVAPCRTARCFIIRQVPDRHQFTAPLPEVLEHEAMQHLVHPVR